jgi:lipopolysaccharide export system protein LptA
VKKILLTLFITLFALGLIVQASDLIIESKTQSYEEKDNKIKFDGNVKVTVDDLKVVGESADVSMDKDQKLDTATFYDKPYAFEIKKNKKREVKANILKLSLITKVVKAQGDTQSIVFEGKTPVVVINADEQEYDTKTGVMTANGAVTILYKELETFSDKAKIMTNKNGDLKDIELIGNARIKQQGGNESFADRFLYNANTKVLTAVGNTTSNAVMDDGKKLVLKSVRQEYIQDKNIFNASGNVQVWYQDYYAVGPKITVYPNSEGKPNEVYFSGRSSITQGVRTIYADKIKMTMKPKDFHAEGNTRTVIKNIGSGDNKNDSGIGLGL